MQQNEILINAGSGETRVALLERNHFAELHLERDSERSVAGLVALGRVTRVLPGMQAAFVDIGLEKAAFLYVGDYFAGGGQGDGADVDDEGAPRRRRGRNGNGQKIPKIESLLREGQEIVVQVAKEPIGTKGARITSHISIAGRHLVLTPWAKRVGVSRRIDADRERRRLREIVNRIRPADLGFIIRTAGEGIREADLEADVKYLTAVWDEIQIKKEGARAPSTLYSELSLPLRALRDFANAKTKRIVIDDEETHAEMQRFLSNFIPEPKPRLERYAGPEPIFDHFGIEANIDSNLGKKVWLKSGGYLIVDQSEALTAIDVNTGRYVGKRDLEETVLKTNLEAVKEIVTQLRFRNIGGLIILDLIDMESAENRDKVYRALQEAIRQDKSKTNILKISELGLVEMTRKRTRESLVQMLCEPCSYCEGRGYMLSAESVAFKALREVRKDLPRFGGRQIAISVNPAVAEVLLGPARKAQEALARDLGREIEIRSKPGLHQEQFEVTALDAGPAVPLSLGWLSESNAEEEVGLETAEEVEKDLEAEAPVAEGVAEAEEPTPEDETLPAALEDEVEEVPAADPMAGSAPAGDAPEVAEDEPAVPGPALAVTAPDMLDVEEESPILPGSEEPRER